MECTLIDLQGRSLWNSSVQLQNGVAEIQLDVPNLAAGMYFLDLRNAKDGSGSWSKVIPVIHQN